MNIREFTVLVRLFESADPELRRRAVALVPELAEWEPRPEIMVVHEDYTAEQLRALGLTTR